MDKVRFGRALGYGARHAAKAFLSAADAASAPDPSTQRSSSPSAVKSAPPTSPSAAAQVTQAAARFSAGSKQVQHASRSFLSPIKKYSSSVLMQVMGTLFSLFALAMGQAVWRLRASFHGPYNTPDAHRLFLACGIFLMFAYFAVSNFVRANRAGRG